VVFHDFRLKPELCRLDGKWLEKPTPYIKDLTLAELKRYDVGRIDPASKYAREFPHCMAVDGERIPTLAEVLEVTGQAKKPFYLQVELKSSFFDRTQSADPVELATAAAAVLKRAGYFDRTIFVGFDWAGLIHAKKLAPDAQCWFTTMELDFLRPPAKEGDTPQIAALRHWNVTGTSPWAAGFDASKYDGSIQKAIKAAGGDGWFPWYRDATDEAVREAKALGLKVGAWTVNDPADMKTLIARGLDGICTDRPDLLMKTLRTK
jgi:glycerophosphoryl diester phosphodiesterase